MLTDKISNYIQYIKYIAGYMFMRFISLFARSLPKYKNLWLVSERNSDARDNGYHFFKYLCKEQPQINCAYIIDKSSADYERVSKLGKTISPNTPSHMLALACAKVCISTHIMGFTPDPYRFAILDKYFKSVRGKKVFLQHGIIMNDLKELYYPASRPDLFICTAIPEYNFLKSRFNYPPEVIQRIGLCRYDRLNEGHTVKRQILVMPTWRIYLRGLSDADFIKSDYYKSFNSLLNSAETAKMLDENNFDMVFYLHFELQPYTGLFKSINKRIKTVSFGDADVQTLLMESAILVTDYSSVFFDFAYMKKPLAYFWFDEDNFFGSHYQKGYFDFYKDGFGPVLNTHKAVTEYIAARIKDNLKPEKEYSHRSKEFFCDLGKDHCKKTYEAICNTLN